MSLQAKKVLMATVKIPAALFGIYQERLLGPGGLPAARGRGLADFFWLRFSGRALEAKEAAQATESPTALVERMWLRNTEGICDLALALMGLGPAGRGRPDSVDREGGG